MQENRSFDSYFGTYPGADGIPMTDGKPSVCVPNPATGECVRPYRRPRRRERRRPARRGQRDRRHQRRQDGRVHQPGRRTRSEGCTDPTNPACAATDTPDVMGYHTAQRHPELLDVRRRTSCSRTTCSNRTVVEPARAPVPWCRRGRRAARSTTTRRAARTRCRRPASARLRRTPREPAATAGPDLRLDRPHLPAPPHHVVVGLLRRRPAPSPTARTTPPMTCAPVQQNADTRASGTRCRTSTPCSSDGQLGNIQPVAYFYDAAKDGTPARGVAGSSRPARSASTRPAPVSAARPTSPASSTR